MTNRQVCKIWAIEINPENGSAYWCHADAAGLKGNSYYKGEIDEILRTRRSKIPGYQWILVRCSPVNNVDLCDNCKYRAFKNLQGYFHD